MDSCAEKEKMHQDIKLYLGAKITLKTFEGDDILFFSYNEYFMYFG